MVRVLQIFCEPLANGGQESFIMNMYRNINYNEVQFDFFTPFSCENVKLKEEIERLGGKVWTADRKFDNKKNKCVKEEIKKFLKNKQYEIVHIHSGSTYSLMIAAKIARETGVNNVIVHSHCGGFKNLKYRIIKIISKNFFLKYPTHYFACSKLAAEWKFPKKIIKDNKYIILNNAIDTNTIYYSEEIRNKKREELQIEDKFVVGHIGRFSIQKNHDFLIDIFYEIQKKKNNAVLLLIGVGELQDDIRKKVSDMGLNEKVVFLNLRKDISELLNAMDAFVLPSFFEGLPVVGVEAQATGLQVFTSTGVTRELPLSEISYYYSLQEKPEVWANHILNECKEYKRSNTTKLIKKSGYDVAEAAKRMQKLYIKIYNGQKNN